MIDPRYPVGPYAPPAAFTPEILAAFLDELDAAPRTFAAAFDGLDAGQLDTPYRQGGWTLRQVAHHVPDSHLNAYVRHKLAVTEELPTINAYAEDRWARLGDVRSVDIGVSLRLLELVHVRWLAFLRALEPADFERCFVHPEGPRVMSLAWSVGMYVWHSRHHTAHVTRLRDAKGW